MLRITLAMHYKAKKYDEASVIIGGINKMESDQQKSACTII